MLQPLVTTISSSSSLRPNILPLFFFFNVTAPTEIYPLSLHAALPISPDNARTSPLHASRYGPECPTRSGCAPHGRAGRHWASHRTSVSFRKSGEKPNGGQPGHEIGRAHV